MDLAALIEALRAAGDDEAARIAVFADYSDEQIDEQRSDLRERFRAVRAGEVEGVSSTDVETLGQVRDAIVAFDAEHDRRAAAAADAEAQAAAMEAEITASVDGDGAGDEGDGGGGDDEGAGDADSGDDEGDDEGAGDADGEGDDGAADDGAAEGGDAPDAVEAAVETPPAPAVEAPRPRRNASLAAIGRHVPQAARPRPGEMVERPRWQALDGVAFADRREMAERFVAAIDSIQGLSAPPGFTQKIPVVRLDTTANDDLHRANVISETDDHEAAQRKIEAITAAGADPESWDDATRALVASGGWCAPAEPRYDVGSIVTAARPFRDGLPSMNSRRGTVNYVRQARLSSITANASNAAITTWENSTDESPGGSTKTRQTMTCKTIVEEEVGAVVARLRFGNFHAQAFPEDVAADIETVQAAHARVAEKRLLDKLITAININVTQSAVAGLARDLRYALAQAISEMRYTERSDTLVRAALSDVLPAAIVADLTMQQASGEIDALLVDEATARRIVSTVPNLIAQYVREVPSGTETFITNSTGENLADFPDTFEIPFWFDGTAVFVDSGRLDLGIIRDSTLNGTNDYETFMETFEGLLWLGPYGKTLTLTACPNGKSQVATDITGSICSGS